MIVKHKFISLVPDSANTSKVRSSDWNDEHTLLGPNYLTSTDYQFETQLPGGSLTGGITNSITLEPVPEGVNGTDQNHWLYISGGVGTAEAVLITGGSAISGADSGTITFTPANNHSGAWQIESASAGIKEAQVYSTSQRIYVPAGGHYIYESIIIDNSGVVITGSGKNCSTLLWRGPNGRNCVEFRHATHGYSNVLANVTIQGLSSYTSGWGVVLYNQDYDTLNHVQIFEMPSGFDISGVVHTDILECVVNEIKNSGGIGLRIKNTTEFVVNDLMIYHFFAASAGGLTSGTSIGILLESCGYISFQYCSTLLLATGLKVTGGENADFIFCYFDTCANCVLIEPAGTCRKLTFYRCWAATAMTTHSYHVNPIAPDGEAWGIHFIDCWAVNSYACGFLIAGGEDIQLSGCLVTANSRGASNGSPGISVSGDVPGLRIQNCKVGPQDGFPNELQSYAVFIAGQVTTPELENLIITGNDLRGGITGQLYVDCDGDNRLIKDNLGVSNIVEDITAAYITSVGFSCQEMFNVEAAVATIAEIIPVWNGRVIKLTFDGALLLGDPSQGNILRSRSVVENETVELTYNGTKWV